MQHCQPMGCHGGEGMAHCADVQQCRRKAGYRGVWEARFDIVWVVGGMILRPCLPGTSVQAAQETLW
jgi:hypothetical protein